MICFPFLRQFGPPDVFFPGAPACTWNCMAPLLSFFRQFSAPDVFFPGADACTWNCMAHLSSFSPSIWRPWRFLPSEALACSWNCMAPLSSFSPSIWRPWRFLPWSPCLHLKLHGAPLVLFSVNLAPLTFSSLEPLLALETAWRPSRPFLRQFGAPDVFFPGAPTSTWNCMAPLSRPFLTQFGAPDVFFPGAPACTWNYMAPLSSFSPSILRPWRFLPWIPCLHLKLHEAPVVLFSVNLAPLTFSSLEPLLALETAWRPSRHIDSTFFLSFFLLAPSFFTFFFLIPFFSSFFLFSSLSLSFPFLFSFFLAPLWWPRGARAPKAPPRYAPGMIWQNYTENVVL